ncbi:adenosylcobinamide-phosphate synthase CbiB [Bartonella apis]|uniref:adenosylcobinamide-phosphate synthase CbiB n=1 Tax=Bartonella apis TaxID=1686310 RepID=UPI00242B5F4C|nr:adenosylcobinamide-phosphate synthase CbiB [Bartonella apis]MCT6823488.1 adenosylcobinamide-phosphate synthase CbiB [Bartonella apis]
MERLCFVLLLALLIDRSIGDPDWIWRKVPHPVAAFGAGIKWFETRYNRKSMSSRRRKWYGISALLILLLATFIIGLVIHLLLLELGIAGIIIEALFASTLLAQKSLVDHVGKVEKAFKQGSLIEARNAVSLVVGRETKNLDESAVCRAAIESLAENSSDGVVAPVFWYIILGLPGLFCYKLVNTADSMIGYKNERFKDFGWASARLDDVVNFIPARLTAIIVILTSGLFINRKAAAKSLEVVKKDARHHHSPNAGFPECAFAGALDVKLLGPRIYSGKAVDEPFQNESGKMARPVDIYRAIRLFKRSMDVLFLIILVLFFITLVV